jgi:hypothetical protein
VCRYGKFRRRKWLTSKAKAEERQNLVAAPPHEAPVSGPFLIELLNGRRLAVLLLNYAMYPVASGVRVPAGRRPLKEHAKAAVWPFVRKINGADLIVRVRVRDVNVVPGNQRMRVALLRFLKRRAEAETREYETPTGNRAGREHLEEHDDTRGNVGGPAMIARRRDP